MPPPPPPNTSPLMTHTGSQSSSSSSGRSTQSCHSTTGLVNPAAWKPDGKGKATSSHCSTPQTTWTTEEIDKLVNLLMLHHGSAGDNGFKDEMYNKIAAELNQKFHNQKVPKTGKSCCVKWKNVSTTSGILDGTHKDWHSFDQSSSQNTMWSPIWRGLHLVLTTLTTKGPLLMKQLSKCGLHIARLCAHRYHFTFFWCFFQSHPGAAKYKDNPWPYWNDLLPLMSSSPKQSHVLNPQCKCCPKDTTSSVMVAGPSKTLANEEMAIDDSAATAPASSGVVPPILPSSTNFTNPNATFASTPFAYLSHPPQSTISMALTTMTSISQKWKMVIC